MIFLMKKSILLLLSFCIILSVMAEGEKTEYTDKIIACIKSENPNTITEYVCPQVREDVRAIRSYQAAVSLIFKPIDEEVTKKLKELSTKRSKNLADWSETIRIFSLSPPPDLKEKAYVNRYLSGCFQAIREVHLAR
jgi:Skp family chaperone for outer membrane proteins